MYLMREKRNRRFIQVGVFIVGHLKSKGEHSADINIIDISEDGICFIASSEVFKGNGSVSFVYENKKYTFDLTLLNIHNTNDVDRYIYHCQFIELLEIEQDHLKYLVSEIQNKVLNERKM